MLLHLHVKNIALIDEIEVDFNNNLNILTGETGAGKSIIIGSINAVLGGKVSKDIIRTGCNSGLIELLFMVKEKEVIQSLGNYGIEIENDNELLITRKIRNNGRSVFRINGQVVTTSIVKEIANLLIDIHGQHEHQSLMNKKHHRLLLDIFCGNELYNLKKELVISHDKYIELTSKIDEHMMNDESRNREIAFLEYEINEIESTNLVIGDDTKLMQQYKLIANSKHIQESMSNTYDLIHASNTGQNSVADIVGKVLHILNDILQYDSSIKDLCHQMNNIEIMISDFNRDMMDYIDGLTVDEEQLVQVDNRINLINSLKLKYGQTIEEILQYAQDKAKRLEEFINYEKYKKSINNEVESIKKHILQLCDDISKIRKNKAKEISQNIMVALLELDLSDTIFNVCIIPKDEFDKNGFDDIEFLISTNKGEPLKSLNKVASGGELSRIMLAIKSVLAKQDSISTLIFDEIDAGISGRTASMVAEKLVHISKEHQVLCITHLPQITAMADTHFLIEKVVKNNRMNTIIKYLDYENSIKELARLLGGAKITQTVMKNAIEMKSHKK